MTHAQYEKIFPQTRKWLKRLHEGCGKFGKSYQIYGLIDPKTSKVMYVGMSYNPIHRLNNGHLRPHSLTKTSSKKNCWLKSLLSEGLRPTIIVLEKGISFNNRLIRENYWITKYRSINPQLTN